MSEDGEAERKLGWAREQRGDLDVDWECVRAPCRRGCTRKGKWQMQREEPGNFSTKANLAGAEGGGGRDRKEVPIGLNRWWEGLRDFLEG